MSTIVYGGQGNVQLKHLHQMIKTKKGQELLLQLETCDQTAYQLFQDILAKKVDLQDLYAAMLTTFLYNAWISPEEPIEVGTRFSAHSAGIFNVLLASRSATFQDILAFIKKRAQLVKSLSCQEELHLVMTEDMELFDQKVLKNFPDKFQLAILTDMRSGVLAMRQEDLSILQNAAKEAGLLLKVKPLGVKAPYHTIFLSDSQENYRKMVQELHIQQNQAYEYIFHCNDLEEEILYQWHHLFNWQKIKEGILDKGTDVLDLSPNKFISKQLMKMRGRRDRE
ncbi:CylD [Streptococcus equinus]|uniref:CylD n=1 Tax=Streptococcus equinus TaxID=1335 RepID=UPI000F6F91A2|nr:CylD [Streptococcus equinus]VED90556.1 CylD [Streptococcus equinus]VTS81010.1 CylD [Streptococcus equinus]